MLIKVQRNFSTKYSKETAGTNARNKQWADSKCHCEVDQASQQFD